MHSFVMRFFNRRWFPLRYTTKKKKQENYIPLTILETSRMQYKPNRVEIYSTSYPSLVSYETKYCNTYLSDENTYLDIILSFYV